MKILMLDISGKVIDYDLALCESLSLLECCDVTLSVPIIKRRKCPFKTIKLLKLIPKKYQNSTAYWKRILRSLESVLNYIYICLYLIVNKYDVIHLQWLPFLDVSGIEYYFLKAFKLLSSRTKIVLTIHNIYPHNMSDDRKDIYNKRFRRVECLLDRFIVHTNISKNDVVREFGVQEDKIAVVHHGIFVPNDFLPSNKKIGNSGYWNIIMYGVQSRYKGTDVFVEALSLLPANQKSKVKVTICGKTSLEFLNELKAFNTGVEIIWKPFFIENEELYRMIDQSDIIVLPYRMISQSGVLLLALYFRRIIITSNLPSFKETLGGFSDDMFCESENPQSLANVISMYVNGEIDVKKQMDIIEQLNYNFSWEKASEKTLKLYSNLV